MDENSIAKKTIKKIFKFISWLAVITIAALTGFLANRSPFLAGALLGTCVGVFIGFGIGVLTAIAFAAQNPKEFIELFKT